MEKISVFNFQLDHNKANSLIKPEAPYYPSVLEVMRSCGYRSCFEHSKGFERRLGFAVRVGIAFHKTLQSFGVFPLPRDSKPKAIEDARDRFAKEIKKQIAEKEKNIRESIISIDYRRVDRAAEAISIEAQRVFEFTKNNILFRQRQTNSNFTNSNKEIISGGEIIDLEVKVKSLDGLIHGRIDRAEVHENGVWIIDYKSAMRDEMPERYERQVQLYAYLWHQTWGDWPRLGILVYPLTSKRYEVDISPERCKAVLTDSYRIIENIRKETHLPTLASPGDICKVCDFRPWCEPFWAWQIKSDQSYKRLQNAIYGFEGKITSFKEIKQYFHIEVDWFGIPVSIRAPKERFPHFANFTEGKHIRVLDVKLKGLRHRPQGEIIDYSEIFFIEN